MGNTAAKEERRQAPQYQNPLSGGRSSSSPQPRPSSLGPFSPDGSHAIYASRHGRGSRPELSALLGLGPSARDERTPEVILEQRRENRAEREAKKQERERVARERERERSLQEESVDGGFLVTQGVYTGVEDFSRPVVRQLMVRHPLQGVWLVVDLRQD